MRRIAFYIPALFWLSATAQAQQVYRCDGQDGVPSYQSAPCAQGPASKVWDASQPDVSPADQARIDRQRSEAIIAQQQRSRRAGVPVISLPSGPTESQQRASRCNAARRERDAYFERRGLHRTHDELRRWDEYVRTRCK